MLSVLNRSQHLEAATHILPGCDLGRTKMDPWSTEIASNDAHSSEAGPQRDETLEKQKCLCHAQEEIYPISETKEYSESSFAYAVIILTTRLC